MRDTLVIIPAYNEESNITKVLTDVKELGEDFDILVVNDGSSDRTAEMVRSEKICLVSHPFNLGYGAAIQTGYKYAVLKGYRYVLQCDADGQHDPIDLIKLARELKKNDVEMVIGSRFLGNGTLKTGILKKLVINVFRFLIRHLAGIHITDPTSGLKGLSRQAFGSFSRMGRFPVDFPDADILIEAIRGKRRVREVSANMRERSSGQSMHSGIRPVFYIIKVMLSILIVILRDKLTKEEYEYNG